MKNITIYTSYANDGTIRMALHPMRFSPNWRKNPMPHGRYDFKFRVAGCGNGTNGSWVSSCRCREGLTGTGIFLAAGYEMRKYTKEDMSEVQAIKWLLGGSN
jgi:hypothetical protein